MQGAAISNFAKTLKPSTEVWTTMRVVTYLYVCFFEMIVKHNSTMNFLAHEHSANQSLHPSGAATPNPNGTGSTVATDSASSVGAASESKDGGTGATDASKAVVDESMITLGFRSLVQYWKKIGRAFAALNITADNFVNSFSWEIVPHLLALPYEFMHVLGDIDNGDVSAPKTLARDRMTKASSVNWRTGVFYAKLQADDHVLGTLRILAGNACFSPKNMFKSDRCVSVLCQWARHVIAGIFAGKTILSRSLSKFPHVASNPPLHAEVSMVGMGLDDDSWAHDHNAHDTHDMESSMAGSIGSLSMASSVLVGALRNINATVPGSQEEYLLATAAQAAQEHAAAEHGQGLSNKKPASPKRRIEHFIATSTQQSSALHTDLPADLLAASNTLVMANLQNKVNHQANTALDGDTKELHVVAYTPVVPFPSSMAELEESLAEIDIAVPMLALATARPCDRVDLLVGCASQRKKAEHAMEAVAASVYAELVMSKTRSPLHKVMLAPYGPSGGEGLGLGASGPPSPSPTSVPSPVPTAASAPGTAPAGELRRAVSLNVQAEVPAISFNVARAASRSKSRAASSDAQAAHAERLSDVAVATTTRTDTLSAVDSLLRASEEEGPAAVLDSVEDDLYAYMCEVMNGIDAAKALHMAEEAKQMDTQVHAPFSSANVVFVKELYHVFTTADIKKLGGVQRLPHTVLLAPPLKQKGLNWPAFNTVSRYVCCVGQGDPNNSAFQTALRLAKPGDLILLVHVIRRRDELTDGALAAEELQQKYQNLGFNLHVRHETQLMPPGADETAQFAKALVQACSVHNPTHMVLGAKKSDIQYCFLQNLPAGEQHSVPMSVIRHEKYLGKLHSEFGTEARRRPILVMATEHYQ
jgi:hypothetical protein